MLRKGKGLVRARKVTEIVFRNLSGTAGLMLVSKKFETGYFYFEGGFFMSDLSTNTLLEVAKRIREMREIFDISVEDFFTKQKPTC